MSSLAVVVNGVLNKLVSLLLALIITRFFLPSEYAMFSSAYTVITVFSGFFLMALLNSIISTRVMYSKEIFFTFFNPVKKVMLLIIILSVITLSLTSELIEDVYKLSGLSIYIMVLSPLLFSLFYETLTQSLLIAECRYKKLIFINALKFFILSTCMFFLVYIGASLEVFLSVFVFFLCSYNFVTYIFGVDTKTKVQVDSAELKNVRLSFLGPLKNLSVASMAVILVNWFLQISVSRNESVEALALFNIVFVFYSMLIMLPMNASQIVYNKIKQSGLRGGFFLAFKGGGAFSVVYFVFGCLLIENNFFNFFVGYNFYEFKLFLYFMLSSAIVVTFKQFFLKILIFKGKSSLTVYSNMLWALVNVVGLVNYKNVGFLSGLYFVAHIVSFILIAPYLIKFYKES